MERNQDRHLNEDLLTIAVIDPSDLPVSFRKHLEACPQCKASLEAFEQDLQHIGQMAEAFTPLPSRSVRLPVTEKQEFPVRFFGQRGWIGAAVTVFLIISLVWWFGDIGIQSDPKISRPVTELWEDQELMTEIDMLAENALPQVFMDIYEASDSYYDEKFYQFIIPLPENDSLSMDQGMKGGLQC